MNSEPILPPMIPDPKKTTNALKQNGHRRLSWISTWEWEKDQDAEQSLETFFHLSWLRDNVKSGGGGGDKMCGRVDHLPLFSYNTVDGRHPVAPGMYKTPVQMNHHSKNEKNQSWSGDIKIPMLSTSIIIYLFLYDLLNRSSSYWYVIWGSFIFLCWMAEMTTLHKIKEHHPFVLRKGSRTLWLPMYTTSASTPCVRETERPFWWDMTKWKWKEPCWSKDVDGNWKSFGFYCEFSWISIDFHGFSWIFCYHFFSFKHHGMVQRNLEDWGSRSPQFQLISRRNKKSKYLS